MASHRARRKAAGPVNQRAKSGNAVAREAGSGSTGSTVPDLAGDECDRGTLPRPRCARVSKAEADSPRWSVKNVRRLMAGPERDFGAVFRARKMHHDRSTKQRAAPAAHRTSPRRPGVKGTNGNVQFRRLTGSLFSAGMAIEFNVVRPHRGQQISHFFREHPPSRLLFSRLLTWVSYRMAPFKSYALTVPLTVCFNP